MYNYYRIVIVDLPMLHSCMHSKIVYSTLHDVYYYRCKYDTISIRFLPDKSEDTYYRMFVEFNSIKSDLCSKLCVLDFEKTDMDAVVHVYLETQVKGCFFTLFNLFGVISKVWGYKKNIQKIQNFHCFSNFYKNFIF